MSYLFAFLFILSAHAEVGVSAKTITLGSSLPKSGALSVYGDELSLGARAAFTAINASGGVHGRKVEINELDDAYSPERMFKNTNELLAGRKTFALFNFFGTPTVAATLPLLKKERMPLLFPYTGGEFVRTPVIPTVFTLRVSYAEETYELTRYALDELKLKDFGIFYQDDAYGTAARNGIEKAFDERRIRAVVNGTYLRGSDNVDAAVEEMIKVKPKAVFLLSVRKPAADFIRKAAARGYKPIYLAPSPAGTPDLAAQIGDALGTLYVSEVVPSPEDTSFAIVRDYQRDMKAIGAKSWSHLSLEGYLNAHVTIEALRRAGKELTRTSLMTAIDGMTSFDAGGLEVRFAPHAHQALRDVFLVKLTPQGLAPVKKLR